MKTAPNYIHVGLQVHAGEFQCVMWKKAITKPGKHNQVHKTYGYMYITC